MNNSFSSSERSYRDWGAPIAVSLIATVSLFNSSVSWARSPNETPMSTVIPSVAACERPSSLIEDGGLANSWVPNDTINSAISARELFEQISHLSSKLVGWKGANSVAADEHSVRDAIALARKLVQERISKYPAIGLDEDGSFTFYWKDPDFVIDLSVYGDGTYSFFARCGDKSYSVDEAHIADPINRELRSVLLS